MFKNFDKVFKFTFKNQVSTKGYKNGTIITAVILFIIPVAIFMIAGMLLRSNGNEELKSCGADKIYVVDEAAPDADFSILNTIGIEGYEDIEYINAKSVQEALDTIEANDEDKSLVLQVKKEEGSLNSRIVLPDGSIIGKDDAKNYNDFVKQSGNSFAMIASGISVQDMQQAMIQSEYKVYDAKGYVEGNDLYSDQGKLDEQKNADILPVFNMILTYAAIVIIYLIIIMYGNSILQTIVLEKSNKLMDTMLISVAPESMIFGKMLAILSAGILQLLAWIAGLVLGFVTGLKLYDVFFGDIGGTVVTFFKNITSLGVFKPLNVLVGILALIFGIIVYSSMSAVAGAISSTREEAASNQGLFITILVISFYVVIFKGIKATDVATWLYLLPVTSPMLLPSGICTGMIPVGTAVAGLAILILTSVGLLILAGRLYKMMSLYKGNAVNISKALKMLAGKQ